jgi:glycosyltransferase
MKISILTAALNPGGALRDCLASVAGQSLPAGVEVEHLVLDGGSTDGTVPVLERWAGEGPGRAFRSGPDGGFYEALNRGIPLAGGDVIGILNADDFYFDGLVLARVAEAFSKPGVEGVYGDLVYVTGKGAQKNREGSFQFSVFSGSAKGSDGRGDKRSRFEIKRYWKSGDYRRSDFLWGWMPPHPTIFVRREVYGRCGGFRTDFGSAADYEWILRAMLKRIVPFAYIPHVLVAMREGGMSNRSLAARIAANRNDRRAWAANSLTPLPWTFLLKPLRKLPQWLARYRGINAV